MSSWVDFSALGKIFGAGLVFGAGLPALFAVGLRVLASDEDGPSNGTASIAPLRMAVAALCFAVVLAAVGWGIYVIVDGA